MKKKKKTVFFTAETIKINPKDIKSNIPEKTQLGWESHHCSSPKTPPPENVENTKNNQNPLKTAQNQKQWNTH